MKGFILNIRKAKNEDIIVTVLSNCEVRSYYRFYGARHSILQLGNLIDFEVQESKNGFMPQIRKISHISFTWISSTNHLSIWQNFIKLFEPHLKESRQIDRFYFDLLVKIAKKWHKQNPKRLAVEAYIEILEYEGRLYNNGFCHICEDILTEQVGLMRAYLLAHPKCIYGYSYDKQQIFELFDSKSTIHINDNVVDKLFNTLLKGL
ncbi:MAG TPA: recombination protein RecO [Campylobacterales bacterium]|nr:recombination protein RecO [Campylobacterales bacterium]